MGVGNKLAHTRFDDWSAARSKRLHFGATHVDPNDFVTHRGEAGSRDRANISQSKNANGQTQANSPDSRVIKTVTAQFELYQAPFELEQIGRHWDRRSRNPGTTNALLSKMWGKGRGS